MEEYDQEKQLSCSELHDLIEHISDIYFSDEDPFEAIVIFLHTSVEVKTSKNCMFYNPSHS